MPELLFLDTETTDLNGRLIELALGNYGAGIVSYRCKPPEPIHLEAMAVHHITEEDVADLPAFVDLIDYEPLKAMIENSIVVAHNAPFDAAMLSQEGIQMDRYIDTLALARALYPAAPQYSLQFLRYYLGVRVKAEAHTAEGDVRVLMEIFRKLAQRIGIVHELDSDDLVIEEAIRITQGCA